MRTTIDLPPGLLDRAKRVAVQRRETLSRIVSEALGAYLERKPSVDAPPFELIVRGRAGGRMPSPQEISDVESSDDAEAVRRTKRRAAP